MTESRVNELLEQIAELAPPQAWDPRVPSPPWGDESFSRQMLVEMLSPTHDRGSRRQFIIEAQVRWLAAHLPPGSAILDAACGPGLHALALAEQGYDVTGVDIAPAAIRHAREQAARQGLRAEFERADLRTLSLPRRFDAILLLYGHLHTLPPGETAPFLRRLACHLQPGGQLLLELRAPDNWDRKSYREWWPADGELFGPGAYLVLYEHFWDERVEAEVERYRILRPSGRVEVYDVTERRLTEKGWNELLQGSGFARMRPLPGWPSEQEGGWRLVVARMG